MTNFVKLNELDPFELQDIRVSAYRLARNELANRGITDPDGETTIELANHLFQEAERWASFDEADQNDESYEVIFDEFFTNASAQTEGTKGMAIRGYDEATMHPVLRAEAVSRAEMAVSDSELATQESLTELTNQLIDLGRIWFVDGKVDEEALDSLLTGRRDPLN